jgi:RNA polymerase sigma factor (sigma-70 family)
MYHKHRRLICRLANQLSAGALTPDDLISVGHEAFVRAFDRWDRKRHFCSWLFIIVRNAMLDEVMSCRRYAKRHSSLDNRISNISKAVAPRSDSPAYLAERAERMAALSNEARDVLDMIVKSPGELLSIPLAQRKALRRAARQQMMERGMSPEQFRLVFSELRAFYRDLY